MHAADRYFAALAGVTEPEAAKTIGELFIRVFEDEQVKVGAKYLVQAPSHPTGLNPAVASATPSSRTTTSAGSPKT